MELIMEMEDLSLALVDTLHDLTVRGGLDWRLVQARIQPAAGAVASPSQFEAIHKGARFLLYEEEPHRYHAGMAIDVWLKRHVLAMHDEQDRQVWHAADAALGVSQLFSVVRSKVIRIDQVLVSLIDPATFRRFAEASGSPFEEMDNAAASLRARLRRLRLSFIERFYWRDVLAAREQMVRRNGSARA
jgi:hypothetical protein